MFGWSIERIVARLQADPTLQDSRWKIESNLLRMVYDKTSFSDRLTTYEAHKILCREANREVVPGASTGETPAPESSRVYLGVDCGEPLTVSLPDDVLTECE